MFAYSIYRECWLIAILYSFRDQGLLSLQRNKHNVNITNVIENKYRITQMKTNTIKQILI